MIIYSLMIILKNTILNMTSIVTSYGLISMVMNNCYQHIVRYNNRRILSMNIDDKKKTRLLNFAKSKESGICTPFVSFVWLPLPRSNCSLCNRKIRTEGRRLIFVSTSASHLRLHLKVKQHKHDNEEQKYCSLPTIFSFMNWIWRASSKRGELITGQS